MCFEATKREFNKAMTEIRKEAKEAKGRGDDIIVWKVLRINKDNGTVYSPYYPFNWKVGENKTTFSPVVWSVNNRYYGDRQQHTEINKGFHAYRTKERAFEDGYGEDKGVAQILVKLADVIAANEEEVVFNKGELLSCAEQRLSINLCNV